jgi:predicted phage tail protein
MNAPAMTTVRLYGEAGRRFGRVHRFALDTFSPAEAVQALMSQFQGFGEYLMNAKDSGIGFAVFAGKQNLREDQLRHPVGNEDIRIAPMILGSKQGGVFQIILGVIIIAAATYFGGPTAGAEAASWYGSAMGVGIAMIAGGVVQMLTPTPKGIAAKDKPENIPSYSFNGPINTQAQGNPVPLLYGRLKVGSAVISAGIDTLDTSYTATSPSAGSGSMGGGGGCVAVESILADGRNAASVRPGDIIELSDHSLAKSIGEVTYSVAKAAPCVRIVTGSGVTLVCSITAPIPTHDGELTLAPDLAGRSVAVRVLGEARWESVESIERVGVRAIQHISVNDGSFWAGECAGAQILHHNKMAVINVQEGREGSDVQQLAVKPNPDTEEGEA